MSKTVQQSGPFVGWSLAWLAAITLGVAVLAGRSPAAPGDDVEAKWKTLEADILPAFKERQPLRDRFTKVRGMLGNPPAIPYAGNEAEFDEYFLKYVFPSWTLTDEAHLGSLAKDRDRFLTVDLAKSTGPAHDKLVDLTFTKMSQIAQDQDFHPAVRYNAVLVLGGLNAREVSRTPATNPEPLPKALPVLRGLFENPDESDAVKVAALLGILRHLEWDDFRAATPKLAADVKTPIVQQLIALAQETDPPVGRSAEGHTWMRRRALEGLMYVSQAGPTKAIADAVEKLVADDKEPLALRCTAADIMGRLNYKDPVVPVTDVNGKQLGLLALTSCQAELARLENFEKLASLRTRLPNQYGSGMAGGGGMGGGDMAGMMMGMGGGGGPPPGMQGPNMGGPPSMDMSKMMEGMAPAKGKKGKTKSKTTGPPNLVTPAPGGVQGFGAPKADDKNYRIDFIRRRLRSWLYAVQIGLGDARANPANELTRSGFGKNAKTLSTYNRGVAAYTKTDDQKAEIEQIITGVQGLVAVVETPDLTYETFAEELAAKMKELEQITGPLPTPAAPPAAEGSAAPAAAAASAPAIPDAAAPPAAAKAPAAADAKTTAPAEAPPAAATEPATQSP